jgi:DNA-binding transcriptional regulator YdaS (Cro superfamily)
MPTPTLERRLQRLEAIGQRENELAPERCRFITRAAVQQLSTDELRSALGANEALREGREPTSQEVAAANALQTATEVECRRAGMTLAEFNRHLGAATPAT